MTSDHSHREAIQRIKPIVDDLFDQADPSHAFGDCLESDDEICPLYCSISRIKERYQEPELIGRGGMKEVYRVYDARAVRHVAMAKPLPEFSSDQYDAFLREAHLTARLDHPNIINLFDMDIDQKGRPFFTMELRHGHSLRAVIKSLQDGRSSEEFPLHQRLDLFLRVCDAIAYAHSRRVLHLDIKPENIFVGDFGEVKVCDWGMGVVMAREHGGNESTVLLDPDLYGSLLQSASGTPTYMAPEQKDKRQQKTPQMDIYALGCLLQEMLTLNAPVKSRSGNSGIDSALAATIATAIETDPADRYQRVEEMREDISRFMLGFSTSVERTSLRREAALFFRRHREACSIALGLLTVLAMCVTFFVLQLRNSREQALNAEAVAVEARARSEESRIIAEQAQLRAEQDQRRAEQAQQLTESALVEAEHERRSAEESLAKYMAEKELSNKRRYRQVAAAARHSDFVIDSALQRDMGLRSAIQFALDHMDSILDFHPPPASFAWTQKFWILFLTQDFQAALNLVRDGKEIHPDLVQLAEKYLPHLNSDGHLDTGHFIAVMQELISVDRWRAPLAEKMMIYDGIHDRSPEDKLAIARAWVQINNSLWNREGMTYDPDTATVRLRGNGLTHLNRTIAISNRHPNRFSLLHILKPKVLDLRGTQFQDLSEVDSMQLLELDIRQTPVTDLSALQGNRTLRRLLMDPDQVSESQMASLPKSIEVMLGSE
ncbi:Serine/threonine-protein kinase PknD [Planctomycetes bacterium CA13]|uniref:Serine/threonine-protein kinase PknD n=1 Tax=Novipirellula herctigrandis TaxID=2527986 RepID=A0A5C5Z9K4_9BACT|nr:Serine/threonine-protein kinase PknD [Planctomycetes bacterium CA13]